MAKVLQSYLILSNKKFSESPKKNGLFEVFRGLGKVKIPPLPSTRHKTVLKPLAFIDETNFRKRGNFFILQVKILKIL